MKWVYVCSQYGSRGDIKENLKMAEVYCQSVIDEGNLPICPHLFLSTLLNDTVPGQRAKGLEMGVELLLKCDEVRVFTTLTAGMKAEVKLADDKQIPVTIGNMAYVYSEDQARFYEDEIRESIEEWRAVWQRA